MTTYTVRQYGCGQPTDGREAALTAMRGRNDLWNALVALEREYRAAVEAAIEELAPGMPRKQAFAEPLVRARVDALELERRAAVKRATAASGLLWTNTDAVITAYNVARRKRGTLQFHAWRTARGTVSLRWQNGLASNELWNAGNRQIHIDPIDHHAAWSSPVRAERRHAARTTVRFRVASESRQPVWLELPITLHRPIPDGLVRTAHVTRDRIGTHERWSLVLTIQTPDSLPERTGRGMVALDVGWRKMTDGSLRVATWQDTFGRGGVLTLPAEWLDRWQRTEDTRSMRDQRFSAAVAALRAWLAQPPSPLPDWLREATVTLGQWRAPGRLAELAIRWREARFHGDEDAFAALEAWRRRDKQQLEYEANLRDKLMAQRRDLYRRWAAVLARTYAEVRWESFDLSRMAEQKDDLPRPARHQRVLAAVSVLRQAVTNACAREGVTITAVEAAWTTQTCHACGGTPERFDAAGELVHTCRQCGAVWDQDVNAAYNMLQPQTSPMVAS